MKCTGYAIIVAGAALAAGAAAFGQATRPAISTQSVGPATASAGYDWDELYLNNGRQVFALRMKQDWSAAWPTWTWTAPQSPEITVRQRAWFTGTDDCKPVLGGTHVLITSSSGGVALIRRADAACVFYAPSVNAHSAELVGDRWVAVCSSLRGNELQVFDRRAKEMPAEKLAFIPLAGAHGAVYDWRQEVLWALGTDELLKTKIVESKDGVKIEVLERFALPSKGGHDLFPYFHYKALAGKTPDTARGLFVTVWDGVYVFDLQTQKFVPFEPLAKEGEVKSVTDNLRTGRIVYSKADPESSFSKQVRFLNPAEVRTLPDKIGSYNTKIYKVRWNQPNPFSYKADAEAGNGRLTK